MDYTMLNTVETDILEMLARFKFLVVSQIQPITGRSIGYVRTQLQNLTAKGLIKALRFDRPGKAPNLYFLTDAGKELLLQHEKLFAHDLKVVAGNLVLVKDVNHRVKAIQIHIELYYYLTNNGIDVLEYLHYFDKTGSNNNKKGLVLDTRTKIPIGNAYFIPDAVMISQSDERKAFYLIEMYCDPATTRVLEQLKKHILALSEGSPARKFGIPANPLVLSAFQFDTVKINVIEKLKKYPTFSAFQHLFYFASLEDIQKDAGDWKTIKGQKIEFT